jgi:hypothetical protein
MHQRARETLEGRRKDGANPWKLVRNMLKAYLQEEEESITGGDLRPSTPRVYDAPIVMYVLYCHRIAIIS